MPRTEAGKRLSERWADDGVYFQHQLDAAIDAIEAEAREQGWNDGKAFGMQLGRSQAAAAERARIREALRTENLGAMWVSRSRVLAIIDGEAE